MPYGSRSARCVHEPFDEKPVCECKGVRNASLAIYVLRYTSSPALTPAAHPPDRLQRATPPATPRATRRTSVPSFHPPPLSLSLSLAMPPPHRRTDARPFRSTVSAGSCHHRTGLRTVPDDTAPINRDLLSTPDGYFLLPARAVPRVPSTWPSGSLKECLSRSAHRSHFYGLL